MKEKLKTLILAVLVVTSLLQSYMLAYNRPNLLPANPTEYIKADLKGEQKDIDQLLFPQDIVIHFGEERHTMLYPNDTFYTMILERISDKQLYTVREARLHYTELERLRQETKGIEIRYKTGIPYSILQKKLNLEAEIFAEGTRIETFWFTASTTEEKVNLLILTNNGIYQADRVELSVKELDQFVQFGEHLHPAFKLLSGELYIPEESLKVAPRVRLSYELYTSEQLRNSLFVDPSISRSILQQDGTEIITDGKRGLHIDHRLNWINYSDPVAPMDSESDIETDLYSAVQFVNQHGGWNGKYMLSRLPTGFVQQIRFLQFYESLPIIAKPSAQYGYIQVTMRRRMATGYERSLINIESASAVKTAYELYGGVELEEKLQQLGLERIVSVFPAYEPFISEEYIELIPRWAVEFPGERYEFVP